MEVKLSALDLVAIIASRFRVEPDDCLWTWANTPEHVLTFEENRDRPWKLMERK